MTLTLSAQLGPDSFGFAKLSRPPREVIITDIIKLSANASRRGFDTNIDHTMQISLQAASTRQDIALLRGQQPWIFTMMTTES